MFAKVRKRLQAIYTRLTGASITKTSKEKWEKVAHKGEFEFHKTNQWRNTDDFMVNTTNLFESFGFNKQSFAQKRIIDLGAGSKLRTKYFEGAELIVIEPMAEKCIAEIAWCDLNDASKVYSNPAEERITDLVGTADAVLSINVLDHCFDFEAIIANIHAYLKPGGLAFLTFDEHLYTDPMHPLILTEQICDKIFTGVGFEIQQKTHGFKTPFRETVNIDSYGHGRFCLNYWLIKPA